MSGIEWGVLLALAGIGAGAAVALIQRWRFWRPALLLIWIASWATAAAIPLKDQIAANRLLFATFAILSLGAGIVVWLCRRLPDRRFCGNAHPVEPSSRERSSATGRAAEAVLEYLPSAHKDLLYSILDRGSRELPYSPELLVLSRLGLVEEVLCTYQDRGVFLVPEAAQDLVSAHRKEESRQAILQELRDAESRQAARNFLSLYSAEEIPSSFPHSVYQAAESLSWTRLVDREFDTDGQRFVYDLSDEAIEALAGSLRGKAVVRTRVVLATNAIEGYDPNAPDYSGRALPMRSDEDD